MKKYFFYSLFITLITFLSFPTVPLSAAQIDGNEQPKEYWPDGPKVYAESAILMEASTGLILYEKNIHQQNYPASITKIMTSLLAAENSSLGEVITFSKDAIFNVDLNSSRIGIDVGEKLTMRQALYGLMLESANEVSYAVAEHIGGDIEGFSKMMNEKAKELGCLNTNFTNPHGLPDDNHFTTSYDMALITREAMKNDTFRKISSARTYQIPPTNKQVETRYLRNHHRFLLKQNYFYDDCISGKTGFTNKAKYTLVSVAKRGDLELIAVIMKDDSFEHQYTDTQKLFDYGFDNFSIYSIADIENTNTKDDSVMFTRFNPLLDKEISPIITDPNAYLVLPNGASFEDAKKEISFFSSDSLEDNNIVGEISYTYNNKFVGNANVLFTDDIENTTLKHAAPTSVNLDRPSDKDISEKTNNPDNLKPIIIGMIIASIMFLIVLYFVFIERPRLKRKKAYYEKRKKRKHKDDYIDL